MGGLSAERDVSLDTGAGVLAALREYGHDCVAIDWKRGTSLPRLLMESRVEVVWNALHGPYGEDGAVQGALSCMHIPFTGSGILASALAMDKVASKRIFESNGLATPPWTAVPHSIDVEDVADRVTPRLRTPPLVVKPGCEGSSVGVTIVTESGTETLASAVARAREYRGPTLVETYIAGAELHISILGDEVLGSIEVRPATEFYDYQAKYKRDDTQYLIPPELEPGLVERAEAMSLAAYRALGCAGYGRVDLRVDVAAGRPYILEVNTLPGMTSHSLLPKAAAHVGIEYAELCQRILDSAGLG